MDGKVYDVTCGDACAKVAIACRGACPCPIEVVRHVKDCCGSPEMLAYANAELSRFDTYEAGCPEPQCDCFTAEAVAEDGSALSSTAAATAECVDGYCLARSAETAGTCLQSDECIDAADGGICARASDNASCRGIAGVCTGCR